MPVKSCDVCGSARWETLILHRGPAVCSGGEIVSNNIPLLKKMCRECGFVHTFRTPLDKSIDSYYKTRFSAKLEDLESDYYNFSANASFGDTLNRFVLSHPFSTKGRMLDIGCGKGFFERAFIARYPDWKVEGVDPSVRSIQLAKRMNPTARFYNRKFLRAEHKDNSYDLVCLHTVLNRVPFRNFIGDASTLLKTSGILSVEVALFRESPYQLYFADHHNLFFREHLLSTASQLGLRLVREDLSGNLSRFLFQKPATNHPRRGTAFRGAFDRIMGDVRDIVRGWRYLIGQVSRLKRESKKTSFYGAGTTFGIVLSQTDFPKRLIAGLYDQTPSKIGRNIYGEKVSDLDPSIRKCDAIVLCAGRSGVEIMKKKIRGFKPLIHLKLSSKNRSSRRQSK